MFERFVIIYASERQIRVCSVELLSKQPSLRGAERQKTNARVKFKLIKCQNKLLTAATCVESADEAGRMKRWQPILPIIRSFKELPPGRPSKCTIDCK